MCPWVTPFKLLTSTQDNDFNQFSRSRTFLLIQLSGIQVRIQALSCQEMLFCQLERELAFRFVATACLVFLL